MENLNIDIKKFSEYIVNLIYDVSTFDINNTEEQKVSPLKLQNHVKNLQKDSKNKFFKIVVNFKDLPRTIKKVLTKLK